MSFMNKADIIYFVIPCYNEEAVLGLTASVLHQKLVEFIKNDKASSESRILFVDDGSGDSTWNMIKTLSQQSDLFTGIKLSRNKGHQQALLAGLITAAEYADAVISMDADLQDDISVLDKFLDEYYNGREIVYGVRTSREKDTFFKKFTAEGFYRLMAKMGVDIVFNHADCRLMSKRAIKFLEQYKEVNLFLRGIVPLIGLKSSVVAYGRNERAAGSSKYSLKKMLNLAFDGITSFSIKPIRLVSFTGVFLISVGFLALLADLFGVVARLNINFNFILVSLMCFLFGVQILSMGIVGEYIGKVYSEVKARPRYFVEESLVYKETETEYFQKVN